MNEHSGFHYPAAWDQAFQEGERLRARRTLLRLGRTRFGPPDAATEAALMAVTDLDRLDRMIDAVLTTDSWPQLVAVP
jgi:hypothetical protein